MLIYYNFIKKIIMKNPLPIILILLTIFLNINVQAQSLVGDYSFNGNANDNSGFGNNGIVWGATLTTGRSGLPNSAYHFDGMTKFRFLEFRYSPYSSCSL